MEYWSSINYSESESEGMSDSLQPHGLLPCNHGLSGLFHPWDFPGKSTRMGCHFLYCVKNANNMDVQLKDIC